MTSRRSRIKGIANIPQRRKPENEQFKEEGDQLSADAKLETKCEVNDSKITISKNEPTKSLSEDNHLLSNPLEENPDTIKFLNAHPASTEQVETVEEKVIREELPELEATPASNKPPTAFKRKFLKAPVSINAIKKRRKIEEVKADNPVPEKRQETDANYEISKKSIDNDVDIDSQTLSVAESKIKTDDASPGITVSVSENYENVFQKPASLFNNSHSDTEYPLPPPSPNKANRSRIKAIPRLAHRKTSFSASESEDESKKINRNRNDSVCSTTSAVAESFTECFSPQRPKETITFSQPKKNAIRLEQTRKLAEARREFVRRFGYKKPERHRLTMMDLIFYNPETNPMINEGDTKESDTVNDADDPTNNEEIVDEPSNTNDTQSDEENEIPVPQIKIGPSGEIILDEQSLVIERKEVQRKREELEKSEVVDLDKIKTGYGIYKKNKRTKFWTASETVYFYKALNTIGTDFTLMCELFPNRTRRELKIKFKKEEKMNRNLIDKALMQPCNFDYEDLKSEIELEERELEAIKKHQEEEKKLKEEISKENQRIAMEKIQKRKAEETVQKTYIPKPKPMPRVPDLETPKQAVTKPKVSPKKDNPLKLNPSKRSKKPKLSIQTYMSDSDADESDIATQSESDEDVVLSNKPTRSGRVPKTTQRYDNEFSSIASIMKRNKIPDKDRPENIEPGSIMVITENGPSGEPVYKLYMVTPEQKATPLDVPPDVAEAIQLKKGMTAKSIMTISANLTDDEEMPPENNITISADENITSLREETNITIPADENVTSLRSEANNKEGEENAVSDDQNIKDDQTDGENEGTMTFSEEVDKTVSSDGGIEENTISDDHIKESNEENGIIEGNTISDDHIKEGNEENGVIGENTIYDGHIKEGNEENGVIGEYTIYDGHIKEGNEENGVIEENTISDDHTKEGNEENGVIEENTISDDHIQEGNEANTIYDDHIKEGNDENGIIEENNGTIKVLSIEPLAGYRDVEKNCSIENVRVIATDSDTVILNNDNFVFVNNDEDGEIVLEVNHDGICMKLENDTGNLRTPAFDSSEVRKLTT